MDDTNSPSQSNEELVREELAENGKEAVFNLSMASFRTDERFSKVEDSLMKSIEMTSQLAEKVASLEQILQDVSRSQESEKMTAVGIQEQPQNNDLANIVAQIASQGNQQ